MKLSNSAIVATSDEELRQALAVLISSTRNKKRPFSLNDISRWLTIAVDKLGSYQAVAARIGLSSKMLRQFSYIDRLSGPVQKLFAERVLDSVDAATHLAALPPKDQFIVARELSNGHLDTADVRAVVQLRKVRPDESTAQILKRVKQSKTKQIYVVEFVAREIHDPKRLVRIFQKYLPAADILRVELDGAFGRLVLTASGRIRIAKVARNLGVPIKQVIPRILTQRI